MMFDNHPELRKTIAEALKKATNKGTGIEPCGLIVAVRRVERRPGEKVFAPGNRFDGITLLRIYDYNFPMILTPYILNRNNM